MGRAIVREPSVFLMDEPLSNLDAMLRVETRANIAALQQRLKTTTIYVTHDQVEAMTMGNRVAVLRDGFLQQVDVPRNLYDKPVNVFVAGFIGSPAMNLRHAPLSTEGAELGGTTVPLPRALLASASGKSQVTLGLRPEAIAPSTNGSGLPLQITLVEEIGADAYVYGTLPGDEPVRDKPFIARLEGRTDVTAGQTIHVVPRLDAAHVFDTETGERIS